MSHQPSPGPSHSQSASTRTKSKPPAYPMGITAGAEDVKYQAKYKELKRKVKDIEADNDKLHFKVLNAKRNIQRMKLERAILYERLGQISPSPAPAPPGMVVHHSPAVHSAHLPGMEPDPNFIEYSRPHSRVAPGRPLPAIDTSVGPNAHHSMPPLHSSRRGSGSGPLPPFTQLPPMLDSAPRSPHHERTRSHSSHNLPPQQAPYHGPGQGQQQYSENLPPMQHVLHSPPLSDREREGSRSRRHDLHELAGTHDSHAHSMPPISPSADTRRVHNHQRMGPGTYINDPRGRELEREREREREWEDRDHHERDLNYSNTRQREREPSTGGMHSPPGTHRSRDYPEQHHSRAREEYYHENSGPSAIGGVYSRVSRSGTPGSGSRSASVGANDGPSRPDSRGGYFDDRSRGYRHRPPSHPEYYPNEQLVREPPARDTRPPAHYTNTNEELVREPSARDLRPPAHYTKEPLDFVHEDGRSQSRDRSGSGGFPPPPQRRESGDSGGRMREREGLDSRKKNRGEMDVDEEIEENTTASGGGGMSTYTGGGVSDERDRGLQRYHRGSGDNIEDVRMGP